jgi:hypothetical protein
VLPALTFARPRVPSRRIAAAGIGIVLLIASAAAAVATSSATSANATDADATLAHRLTESTWALAVPTAWLAAPLADVRANDSVDLLAVRVGDRPLTLPLAADLRVMVLDDRSVVFEVDEESATAIATARASGLLIIPLLRSAR